MTVALAMFDDADFERQLSDLAQKPLMIMSNEELTILAVDSLGIAGWFGRRTASMTYVAGRVLKELKERLKEGDGWVRWQREQGLARSTVANAIGLYEQAEDIKSLYGLTIMEAYRKYNVLPQKKKALPKPDDDMASNASPALLKYPEDEADGGMSMDEGSSGDPREAELVWDEGKPELEGTHEEDEGVDESPEAITIDKETLMKTTRDIAKSVTLECLDDMKAKLFASLEITDELTAIAENAFLKALRKEPIEPDARLEVALDKMYSAILEVKTVGLQGSAKETAWLLEKMVLAAQARLQRAG